ncbi:MAG: hypothetical protein LKF37_09405 [Lentilactobacillus diolivorans]|jgi:hypothetical protein|nr:hypothetical protein [Lentilactobacillus diolivorans]
MMLTKQLDSQELEKVFREQKLHVTAAVNAYLGVARQCADRVRIFKKTPGFEKQVDKFDDLKQKFMWKALKTAMVEKEQHWRFIEDADYFKDRMKQKYGDLDFINDLDDLRARLEVAVLKNIQQSLKDNVAIEQFI